MNEITTIITAVTACVVIFKLFTMLGRKTGNEEERAEEANRKILEKRAASSKDSDQDARPKTMEDVAMITAAEARQEQLAKNGALASIFDADQDFDVDTFLGGAKRAYETTLLAFASGDLKTLKGLLSAEIYDDFREPIEERKLNGNKAETEIISVNDVNIIETSVENDLANVQVKFTTDLVSSVTDSAGEVIEGDPNAISSVVDLWTFSRSLKSKDPNWFLSATEDENDG